MPCPSAAYEPRRGAGGGRLYRSTSGQVLVSAEGVVVPVVCPISFDPDFPKLSGGENVRILAGSRLRQIRAREESREEYFCNFEENPLFRARFVSAGLRVGAVNENGVARAVELPDHPFFFATQFQPQMTSRAEVPHPLLTAFVHLLTESA